MTLEQLPALNACLNTAAAVLLLAGYVCIRRKAVTAHKVLMLAALGVSAAFLTSYLIYHFYRGSTKYGGHGLARTVYFVILLSHTILAVLNVPLVVMTVTRALRRQFDRHRRIARWTLHVWMYFSVNGGVVYVLLYRPFDSGR